MKRRTVAWLVLCLLLWSGFAVAGDTAKEKAAVSAATDWLVLVDAGSYGLSWQEASGYFRNAVTKEAWVQSLEAARAPMGAVVSRQVKSATYTTSLPGAPDGEYVVIQLETSFKNKASATETVTPMREMDGSWKVSGYYIR